jgi:lipoxygenase/linoleate 9S-lipoxygenase
VKALFKSFIDEVSALEKEIEKRNADPTNTSRNPALRGMAYTLLLPSSAPGVTMRGVPYSISI